MKQLYLHYPHKAVLCVARAMTQSLTLRNPKGKMVDLVTTDKETEIVYRVLATNIADSWKVTDGSNAVARETSLATAVAIEVVRDFPSIDTRAAHLLRLAVYNTVPFFKMVFNLISPINNSRRLWLADRLIGKKRDNF